MLYRLKMLLACATLISSMLLPSHIQAQSPPKQAPLNNVLTMVPKFTDKWQRNFNPFIGSARLPTTMQFIYEPLVIFNEFQEGKPEYRLATDYRYSEDLKTIIFTLREGVKWSDGIAFSADDVVYSLNLIKQGGELDPLALKDAFNKVEKTASNEVSITLNTVNTMLASKIVRAPIVPAHIWSNVVDPVNFKNADPVGTGPFTKIEVFNESVYVQCRNPHYYQQAQLAVDCIKMPQIGGNTQLLAAAKQGTLDWTNAFIAGIEDNLIAQNSNYKYWFPAGGSGSFLLNFNSPKMRNQKAFRDVNFRRAFSMAIDRKAIVDLAGYGFWKVNEYPDALGEQFKSWADSSVLAEYGKYNRYNLQAANALLDNSGYFDIDGDGYRENKDGERIRFKIMVPNGWSDFINAVQISSEGLRDLGINVTISTPSLKIMTDKMKAGTFDAAFTNHFSGQNPYRYYYLGFHSSQMNKGRFAAHHFSDPALDTLIEGFTKTSDSTQQHTLINQIQQRIAANQTVIPTMSTNYNYQYNTERFTGWFSADNPVANPTMPSDTPERLLHVLSLKPVK